MIFSTKHFAAYSIKNINEPVAAHCFTMHRKTPQSVSLLWRDAPHAYDCWTYLLYNSIILPMNCRIAIRVCSTWNQSLCTKSTYICTLILWWMHLFIPDLINNFWSVTVLRINFINCFVFYVNNLKFYLLFFYIYKHTIKIQCLCMCTGKKIKSSSMPYSSY